MASIEDFSTLLLTKTFSKPDLAEVNVHEFVTRLSSSEKRDPGGKGKLKYDEQRLLELDILLCAGLCLGEETIETIKGRKVTIGNPKGAVEDLLTGIFGEPIAVLKVLKTRPRLVEVKKACCDLPVLFLPEHAVLRRRTDLKTKLKRAEACRMSKCNFKSQSHLDCIKTWKDIDEILRHAGGDLLPEENKEKIQLIECMKVEVVGFHFYMIFLHLKSALGIELPMPEKEKNAFEFALDACEEAYSKVEKKFREGLDLDNCERSADKKIATNSQPPSFKCILSIPVKKIQDLAPKEHFSSEMQRKPVQRETSAEEKMHFHSGKKRISNEKIFEVLTNVDDDVERARRVSENNHAMEDDEEHKQSDERKTIAELTAQIRRQIKVIKEHRKDKKRLEAEIAEQLNKEKKLGAELIALREEEEKMKQTRDEADSKKLLASDDYDEMACQLRDERQGRYREQQDAVREKMELQQRLETLAVQLRRETDDRNAQVTALQKTLREKEEMIELQQKQNDEDSKKLHGELRELPTDRDDLKCQLREEKEGRHTEHQDAVRVQQSLEADNASLADQLEKERRDRMEFSAELIALRETLREKEETIEIQRKQNDADSERLHGEIRKLEMDRDELTFQLRNEREGHCSLQVEAASLADQLERENSDKKELSAKLIALEKIVIAKEETIELRQKQANEDLERLDGEVRKLRTDRDDLGGQLHEERELRHKERQDAARERSNAVERLQKQLEDMKERHRIETNGLKADVVAEAAALKRQRDKSLEHYFKAEEMQLVLFLGSTRMLRSAWLRTVKWSNYQTQIDRARLPSATEIYSSTHTTWLKF